jgi:hypothetical protein
MKGVSKEAPFLLYICYNRNFGTAFELLKYTQIK